MSTCMRPTLISYGTKAGRQVALDNLGLRLTIRLGAMLAVAIAALATIIKH